MFPRVGFIVTNLKWATKRVVRFYNRRGTAEQWIKEGKQALNWTRLSCRRFKDNQVRLQLFALDNARLPGDMSAPGWKLHPLAGELKGHWAITVNGNWRLTLRFEGEDAVLVDYQDYH